MMKVRKPKTKGNVGEEIDNTKSSHPSVKTNHERSRYPSEELIPLEQYQAFADNNEKERWMRSATTYLRAFIAEGISREEIKLRLGIDDITFDLIEARLVESDGMKYVEMGTAHRFYYFTLKMEQCARELDSFIDTHIGDDPRKSGVVGAIKAKAQIHKDVLTMGQDLGIINKRAKELRMFGEINLSVMPNEKLKELYVEQMERFDNIIRGTKALPDGYSAVLNNATSNAYQDADQIIDAEFEETQAEQDSA